MSQGFAGSAIIGMMLLSADPLPAQTTIPLCAGLTIVGAVNEPRGDYEPIITVESVDRDGVNILYSAQVQTPGSLRQIHVRRRVLLRDMQNARLVIAWFDPSAPKALPGTTALGPSTRVLRELKTKGQSEIGLIDRTAAIFTADRSRHPNVFDNETVYPVQRVGAPSIPVSVVVNDAKVTLRAVHARGEYMGDVAEWLLLDDVNTPIGLGFRFAPLSGTATLARVVKISFTCDPRTRAAMNTAFSSELEQSLLKSRKADVYHIYFDFNSDRIREESEPTLKQIAAILGKHGDWRLGIIGHTDNIGGDRFNLDLSRRRAASVRNALVSRYRIDASRLSAGGAGASQPRETNSTLEGRARNRRVELLRQE